MLLDRLEALRQRFRKRCAEDLLALRAARSRLGGLAEEDMAFRIHRLAGLAGSLGYGELSRLAGLLDDQMSCRDPLDEAAVDPLEAELARVAASPAVSQDSQTQSPTT